MTAAGLGSEEVDAQRHSHDRLPPIQTHSSSLVEKVLEYRFLAAVTAELLRRSIPFEVLRSDVDCNGHDLVIEAAGVVRHIQLKAMVANGRRANITVHTQLATKPSGCVVWMLYDPTTYAITSFRWFGGAAGQPMPPLGEKLALHSRANAQGVKARRDRHRIISAGRFEAVSSPSELVDRLFCTDRNPASLTLLRRHLLREETISGEPWLDRVRLGDFAAIPEGLDWANSAALAHLIDGYALADEAKLGDPAVFAERQLSRARSTGIWHGGPLELWTSLFLEHRRWRFSSPFEPDESMAPLLDKLVHQLQRELLSQPIEYRTQDG